jgi:hypothetical protein
MKRLALTGIVLGPISGEVKNKTVLWRSDSGVRGADIPHYLATTSSSSLPPSLRCHLLPCPFSSPIHPQLSTASPPHLRPIAYFGLNPARPLPPPSKDSLALACCVPRIHKGGAFLECSVPALLLCGDGGGLRRQWGAAESAPLSRPSCCCGWPWPQRRAHLLGRRLAVTFLGLAALVPLLAVSV